MSDCEASSVILYRVTSNIRSEDRRKRREALEEFSKIFFEGHAAESITLEAGFKEIQKDVLKSLYDVSESVRDSSISVLNDVIKKLELNEEYLSELMPILRWRLGENEVNEPSEEIRLRLVTLIDDIILKKKERISPYTTDLVEIFTKTLVDSYPKVRQQSCKCAQNLACTVPQHFYQISNKLIKPILASFNHQHFRMRVAAIEALGKVVRYGASKNLPAQEVFGSLAERLFDSNARVRSAITKVLGDWLINWYDRYSFFTKMIPLILTCLCDELPELREEAWDLWEKAGLQYEQENEQELKDKMDFLSEKPNHYPSNVLRPNLGCRTLVQRNTCQIIPALSRELEDWKNDVQVKSAQLLCWLVLHAETDVTQHTGTLLTTMYKACNQTDLRIVENVEKACEYMAYFTTPDTYMKLVLQVVEDVCTPGHLCVLSALIRGTRQDLLDPHFDSIVELLSSDNICKNRDSTYQFQLLKCCESLINSGCGKYIENINNLFVAIVTVKALSSKTEITDFAQDLLLKLTLGRDKDNIVNLYEDYAGPVIEKMTGTVETWTSASYDHQILLLILDEGGYGISTHLLHIMDILKIALRPESDIIVKSKFFTSLSKILCRRCLTEMSGNREHYYEFIQLLINDCICPNLVWHAGRSAEALRTVVLACLCAAVLPRKELSILFDDDTNEEENFSYFDISTKDVTKEIFNNLFPLLINLVEDSTVKSRLFSLKLIQYIITIVRDHEILNPEHINQTYPILLKRLDDVSDNVRMESVRTLAILYGNLPNSYNPQAFRPHLESLFSTMLIHLDDPNPNFQQLMTDAMKTIGRASPKILYDKLYGVKERFRNCRMCSEILQYLKHMNQNCEDEGEEPPLKMPAAVMLAKRLEEPNKVNIRSSAKTQQGTFLQVVLRLVIPVNTTGKALTIASDQILKKPGLSLDNSI